MDLAEQSRHLRQQLALRRGREHFPQALAAQVRAHVEARRAVGATVEQLSADLGLPTHTLYRWRREAPVLRPVQVVAEPRAGLTVHGPCGLRIEGLDLTSLAALLRRLG